MGTDLEILQISEQGPIIEYKVLPLLSRVERGTVSRGESDSGTVHSLNMLTYRSVFQNFMEQSVLVTVCALLCLQDMTTCRLSWYNQKIQHRQCTYNVTLTRVRATVVAVGKQ